jgi:methionyl-tRNA synthetase
MLLAAGVPLPRQVYVHGFVYSRGEKLSKSLGNIVDPVAMAKQFGADSLRFFLLDSFPTGRDGEFSHEMFVEHVNTHLANKFGNLASRTMTLVHMYFGGQTPAEWDPASLTDPDAREALEATIAAAQSAAVESPRAWDELRLNEALEAVWTMIERANEFTERTKPWASGKDPARRAEVGTVLAALLEVLRLAAVWAWPAMPAKCETLWTMLGQPGSPGDVRGEDAMPRFCALPQRQLGPSQVLFPRIDLKQVLSGTS